MNVNNGLSLSPSPIETEEAITEINRCRSGFFRMRGLLPLLLLTWLLPAAAGARSDDPTLTICNDCNSGFQYSHAAVQAAEFGFDSIFTGGTDEVYVVNIPAEKVLIYRVTRTLIDPDPSFLGDESFQTEAAPIDGDPGFVADLVEAIEIIGALRDATTEDISAEELEGLPPDLDSALDLVGPESGPAGLNRTAFENVLTDRYRNFWNQQIAGITDLIARVLERFVSDGILDPLGPIEVVFPDGTKVRVKIESAGLDRTDFPPEVIFEFDTDETSVTAPGIPGVPQVPGQLAGFGFSTRDPGLDRELEDLLRRLGAEIDDETPGGGLGGGQCLQTTCRDVFDPEKGRVVFKCTKKIGSC